MARKEPENPTVSGRTVEDTDIRDLTEQERIQRALEESERKFRQLAEQSILGIVVVQDELYKYVNPRMAEMFGYEPEELVAQKGPADLASEEDRPGVANNIRQRLAGEKMAAQSLVRGVRKDGEVIDLEVYTTNITSGGEPALLCYMLDVTARRRLERELLRVQEEERRRIGKDLHDSVGSELSGLLLILGSHERRVKDGEAITLQDLEELREIVEASNQNVRQLSHGLHPSGLEEQTLQEALDEQVKHIGVRFHGTCTVEVPDDIPELRTEAATQLYRIAQEALNNAVTHAGADEMRIRLREDGDRLVLTVEDDGAGFDPDAASSGGIGLNSMRYRAAMVGARLTVESSPGAGTAIRCRAPMHQLIDR